MLDLHNNRYLLSELLQPPAEYDFAYALATTYSLDLNTLLAVPLKLLSGENADPTANEIGLRLLQAIHEQGRKIRVFHQYDRILFPQVTHPLLCWLEEVVRPVPPPPGGSFHPKVWVIRYEERDGDGIIYRCLIGSRNLTYDQSADVLASIDGRVGETIVPKAAPLADFFADLCHRYDPDNPVANFIADLRRTVFTTDGQFEDFNFLFHTPGQSPDWLPRKINGGIVISPFLTPSVVERLANLHYGKTEELLLVSYRRELSKLTGYFDPATKEGAAFFHRLRAYHLKDTTLAEFEDPELEEENTAPPTSPAPAAAAQNETAATTTRGVHAKVYGFTVGHDQHLFLGSANATYRAHNGKNVEAMLHLTSRRQALNRYYLAKALNLDGNDSFFERYHFNEPVSLTAEDAALPAIEDARTVLTTYLAGTGHLRARLQPREDYYDLAITVDLTDCPPPAPEIELEVRYLFGDRPAFCPTYGDSETQELRHLTAVQVTRWVVFELRHAASAHRERFVLLADIDQLPDRRDDLILSGMFTNQQAFFGYLQLLLSENEYVDPAAVDPEDDDLSAGPTVAWKSAAPLYETLARQLVLAPEKIDRVDRFVALMERDGRIDELELAAFLKFWQVFREAAATITPQ